jgi:hypothetical protein
MAIADTGHAPKKAATYTGSVNKCNMIMRAIGKASPIPRKHQNLFTRSSPLGRLYNINHTNRITVLAFNKKKYIYKSSGSAQPEGCQPLSNTNPPLLRNALPGERGTKGVR